jgi:hypothetical protein
VAERLRRRYPPPLLPRPVLIIAVSVLAAFFLGWLIWAGLVHASPAVSANVSSYQVVSDREIIVTVTVQRPDPSIAVVCQVVAQASDFTNVGSVDQLKVGPRPERIVDVRITLKTLRRATSASVKSCSVP